MLTLNLKVLLIRLKSSLMVSMIIWLGTCLLGSAILSPTGATDIPFYQLLVLSLIFSLPAQAIIVPAIFLNPAIRYKIFFASTVTLLSCSVVIALFLIITEGFPLDRNTIASLLMPYVISSLIVVPITLYILDSKKK
jgi:hypothetical protein